MLDHDRPILIDGVVILDPRDQRIETHAHENRPRALSRMAEFFERFRGEFRLPGGTPCATLHESRGELDEALPPSFHDPFLFAI